MPKQSAETGRYVLTPDHFEKERAALQKDRQALTAKHQAEMDEVELKIARLEVLETDVAALAKRYAKLQAKVVDIGKPKKNAAAGRPVPGGRPYTPEEDERLIAANRGEMPRIAEEMGRNYSAVGKRREVLMRKRREAGSAQPVTEVATSAASAALPSTEEAIPHDPEAVYATAERGFDVVSGQTAAPAPSSELRELVKTPAPWERATSENPQIVEAAAPKLAKCTAPRADSGLTAAPLKSSTREAIGFDDGLAPGLENPNVGEWNRPAIHRPGKSVTGRLLDSGPLDQRVYDPITHASRSSE